MRPSRKPQNVGHFAKNSNSEGLLLQLQNTDFEIDDPGNDREKSAEKTGGEKPFHFQEKHDDRSKLKDRGGLSAPMGTNFKRFGLIANQHRKNNRKEIAADDQDGKPNRKLWKIREGHEVEYNQPSE